MDELTKKINNYLDEVWVDEDMMVDETYRMLYTLSSVLWLNVDFDISDDGSDVYIYATVRVPNMIWDWRGYNVIIDVDVKQVFDNQEELVDEIVRLEQWATKVLSHFKK